MENGHLTRRSLLRAAALAGTALSVPFVHSAHAAGKLACGFWDHWVPGANDTLTKLCKEWGDKEKVDVAIDYITSQGDKNLLTIAAEAQSHSGHDILAFPTWYAAGNADNLEPVDDIVNELTQKYGKVTAAVEYLGKQKGHWVAVPATVGSQSKPPCARIDLFKQHVGIDLTQMYPAGAPPNKELADKWTWDLFLQAAEKCSKAGLSVRHAARADDRRGRLGGCRIRLAWLGARRPGGQRHGQIRCDKAGPRMVQKDRAVRCRRTSLPGTMPATTNG